MCKNLGTRASVSLAVAAVCWLGSALPVQARGYPFDPPPTTVSVPPPVVTGCQSGCACTNTCGCIDPNCGSTPPQSSHMPEPASVISGLIGAGLASLYGWRRKKAIAAE